MTRCPGVAVTNSHARSWLLAPIHLAALATGAKSFRDNLFIGSPALNRAGLHVARMRLAWRMAEWRRQRLLPLISSNDRAAFGRDGIVVKRDFLPQPLFTALKREALTFAAPARQQAQGDAITRRIALDRRALSHLPAIRALIESPEWLGLVRYIGASRLEPLVYIQTIFAQAREAPPDPQTRLHADTFHPTVKAWLFLTDVAADAGPFTYVPGSHRLTAERLAWERRMSLTAGRSVIAENRQGSFRIASAQLAELGLPPPRILAVAANTLIVADTFGFHARGPSAGQSLRVEIWAYGRRSPFLPWAALAPWTTAALGRRSVLAWKWGDWRARAGLGRQRWRERRGVSPFDLSADA
jgi:Phytanoyl-CoA dioxygenase (PhyH)